MRTIAPCSQCGGLQRQLHKSLAHQSTPTTRPLPCVPRQRRHQHKRQAVAAGAAASAGKFISSAEIPAFIPRKEFLEQLASWATVQVDTEGPRKFGLPMKVKMCTELINTESGCTCCFSSERHNLSRQPVLVAPLLLHRSHVSTASDRAVQVQRAACSLLPEVRRLHPVVTVERCSRHSLGLPGCSALCSSWLPLPGRVEFTAVCYG